MAKLKINKTRKRESFKLIRKYKYLSWLLLLLAILVLLFIAIQTKQISLTEKKYISNINTQNTNLAYDWTKERLVKVTGNETESKDLREFVGTVEYNTVKFSVKYPSSWEVYSHKGLQHIFYPEGKTNESFSLNISGLGSGMPEMKCSIEEFPASLMNYCFGNTSQNGKEYGNRIAWTKDDRNGDIIFRMQYPVERESEYKVIFDEILKSLQILD